MAKSPLFKTRNDIPAPTRSNMAALLNQSLADTLDLRSQVKQAHWNVKGPNFIALHELFDEIAAALDPQADDIAERATALGGTALGTARMTAAHSRLPEYPALTDGTDHLDALIERFGLVAASIRAAIDTAADAGDAGTADLFTGYSRQLDKHLWFLESHRQAGS